MPSVKVRGSTTSLAGGSQWERGVDIILRGGVKCFLTSGRRRLAIRFPHDVSSSNEFIEIVGLTERLEIWPKRLLNEEERNFFSFLPSGLERRHVCKYSTEKIDRYTEMFTLFERMIFYAVTLHDRSSLIPDLFARLAFQFSFK